jgi:hypothetical protein
MQPNEGVSRKWTLLCRVLAELRMSGQNIVTLDAFRESDSDRVGADQ